MVSTPGRAASSLLRARRLGHHFGGYDIARPSATREPTDLGSPGEEPALQGRTEAAVPPVLSVAAPSGALQRIALSDAEKLLRPKTGEASWSRLETALKKTSELPDLVYKLLVEADLPEYYWPTSPEIWLKFIDKIQKRHKTEDKLKKIDLRELKGLEELAEFRASVLKTADEVKPKTSNISQQFYDLLKPLKSKILEGRLTVNFTVDTLLKMTSPHLLNAFQVREATGEVVQNIDSDLEEQRETAEGTLFPAIGDVGEKIDPRFRPRYAALNFKGHEFGAAARNDYGLSYMVLSDEVKENSTFTPGDTFDVKELGAFRLNENGVDAMLWKLASCEFNTPGNIFTDKKPELMADYAALLTEEVYKPNDTYFDVQIHQDVDLRKDADEIVVSSAEMRLFNMDLDLVDEVISNLTGGVFVRVE